MRNCIKLLLIAGIVWAQTDLDKLVLKDGTEYLGEYLKTEREMVYFKTQKEMSLRVISTRDVQTLQLIDSTITYTNNVRTNGDFLRSKLTIEEKAVYDAKKEALKWGLYPPLTGTTFLGLRLGLDTSIEELWDSPLAFPICLGAPYYLLKQNKNNIKSISSGEIKLYEEIYFKEFRNRAFRNIITSSVLTAVAGTLLALSTIRFDDDFYFGP